MTLIDPTPAEAVALAQADMVGLLKRLKLLAKQLRHRPDHSVPEIFAQLLYTVVNILCAIGSRSSCTQSAPRPWPKTYDGSSNRNGSTTDFAPCSTSLCSRWRASRRR